MVKYYEKKLPKIHQSCFVAENASVIGDVEIGKNASIWYNTVMRGDLSFIKIGKNTNIQDNCTVHVATNVPTIIGDDVVVGHNAIIHGCTIGNQVLIGMGAIILDGAKIGNHVIIGAGTIIPSRKIIPDYSVVMGNPYRIVRAFEAKDTDQIKGILERYIALAKNHKK